MTIGTVRPVAIKIDSDTKGRFKRLPDSVLRQMADLEGDRLWLFKGLCSWQLSVSGKSVRRWIR